MPDPCLYETHMHTPLCGHAEGEPEDYAAVAEARGLRGITVTCHNPMPGGFSSWARMDEAQFPEYLEIVARARDAWAGRVDVRLGLECDYFPDHEDYVRRQAAESPFDYVLGSVHPQMREWQERFFTGEPIDFQRAYFDQLATAAETGIFDAISHPDLVKNCYPDDWDLERVFPAIERALDRIAEAGTAMELNTSGLHKSIQEFNPNASMLRAMAERGIPLVLGADAHVPERVAAEFEEAIDTIEASGYGELTFFLDREPRRVATALARASLSKS